MDDANQKLLEGRRRRRALLAEIECSRDEFQAAWDARADDLAKRYLRHVAWIEDRARRRYPPRNPRREEGWRDPQPVGLPPGNPFPWERGGQSHEWKATEAGTAPYQRQPMPWERGR